MFEDRTADSIFENMLDNIDDTIDKREGSPAWDLTYPGAIEIGNAYIALDTVLELGFAETTDDEHMDLWAESFGITRRPAIPAVGTVKLTGPDGTVVPAGTRLQTSSGVYYTTDHDVTLTGGSATVSATAEEGGTAGNVGPGEINSLAPGDLFGIVSVTNETYFVGGVDAETSEELHARVLNRLQHPATSGNASNYRQWALEVIGVGDAKVTPVAYGPGTVKVVLLSTEKRAPTQSVIDEATRHINEQKPIGAAVTVVGAEEVPINISATVMLADGASIDDVKSQFTGLLTEYLKSIAFTDELIRYTHVANLLLSTPIIDYSNFTLNGTTANIQLADGQVGVVGEVKLSV